MASEQSAASGGSLDDPPAFTHGSSLLTNAWRFAVEAHHGPSRRGSTDIDHPVAVAELLHAEEYGDEVVAAALLHDVVEDTTRPQEEIFALFPARTAELVATLTEDPEIADYGARKREHRARVRAAGRDASAMYVADKVARVRNYAEAGELVDPDRLAHYRDTLSEFGAVEPRLPLVDVLAAELPQLESA